MPDHNTTPPPDDDLWKFVQDLNNRLSTMEHRHGYVSSAFPKNDLDKPDYDGHRRAHLQLIEDSKVVAGYKTGVTKTVLTIVATSVCTLIGTGLVQAFTK